MSRLSEKHRKIISISVVLITLIVMAGSFIYIAFKDPSVMNRISGRHQIVVKPKQALRVENTMQ